MKIILDIGVVCVTVLMMGAVGIELEGRHFRAVAQGKGTLVLTLAAQAVVLPALGFGLTRIMTLPPHISAGILLLAACPVGDIANVYTLLARANVALSVTVNALSILFASPSTGRALPAPHCAPRTGPPPAFRGLPPRLGGDRAVAGSPADSLRHCGDERRDRGRRDRAYASDSMRGCADSLSRAGRGPISRKGGAERERCNNGGQS